MLTFFALLAVAVAISGPMALVHLRDRHGEKLRSFGGFAFAAPEALRWLLGGRYRELRDPGLNGLCTPARLSLWAIVLSLAAAGVFALLAQGLGR